MKRLLLIVKHLLLWVVVYLFVYPSIGFVHADEFRPLFRGARAQAMGNAFTAVADDEEALFYNPAGLAGVKQFSFSAASGSIDASDDLISNYPVYSKAFASNPDISTLNQFIGKNLSARVEGLTTLTFPGFEIAAIYDQQAAVRLKDLALPQGMVGAQTTYGIQLGFGSRILKFGRKKGELRFGMGTKLLWRSGGYKTPTLTQLLTLDTKAITGNLADIGMGVGFDVGFQAVYKFKKKFQLLAGTSMTDIGSTSFSSTANPQLSNLTLGLGVRYTATDMVATLAYDFAHVLDYADWAKKNHLGLELKFPLISVSAGMNQLSVSYGVSLDLWLFKVSYLSYGEDQGTLANQDTERRTMVAAAIKFEL